MKAKGSLKYFVHDCGTIFNKTQPFFNKLEPFSTKHNHLLQTRTIFNKIQYFLQITIIFYKTQPFSTN